MNSSSAATYYMPEKDPDGKDVDYNRLQVDFIVKFQAALLGTQAPYGRNLGWQAP